MSNFLNKEELLKKEELKIEKVELSKGHVYVREMTAHEKNVWDTSLMKKIPGRGRISEYEVSLDDFNAKLAVVTLCDKDGNLLFKPEDTKLLSKSLTASNMDKIITMAQKLNAISQEDKEEMLKNSEAE